MTNSEFAEAEKRDFEKIKNFFLNAGPELQLAMAHDLHRHWGEYGSYAEDVEGREEEVEKLKEFIRSLEVC